MLAGDVEVVSLALEAVVERRRVRLSWLQLGACNTNNAFTSEQNPTS